MSLIRQLKGDEEVRACVYPDSLGYLTIGVGRLVDDRKAGAGLSLAEIEYLLNNDIDDRVRALTVALPWFSRLDGARQGVLLNMAFQMGTAGLLGFTNTLKYVENGLYDKAADNMKFSRWAKQTPERAERMMKQMRTGEWQYAPGA